MSRFTDLFQQPPSAETAPAPVKKEVVEEKVSPTAKASGKKKKGFTMD